VEILRQAGLEVEAAADLGEEIEQLIGTSTP